MQNHAGLHESKQSLGTNPNHGSRKGSVMAAVEASLVECFLEQQRRHGPPPGIPEGLIKFEWKGKDRSFVAESDPVTQDTHPSPPQRQRNHPEGNGHQKQQLTKKNMEIFQQQHHHNQKMKEKENQMHNPEATPMTQLDGPRKHHHHHKDMELAKLRSTIETYEANTNNLMKTLCSERESYKAATKQLQKTNENLKNEVARIERSLREVLNKRDDELKLNERFRADNDELVTRNLRLQHDLNIALESIEKSEHLLKDMEKSLESKRMEKKELEEQNRELQTQLDHVRLTMNAWKANTEGTGMERSMGQAMTCAVSKLIFFGSVIAVGIAALLQVVQASPEIDCDYVREALND